MLENTHVNEPLGSWPKLLGSLINAPLLSVSHLQVIKEVMAGYKKSPILPRTRLRPSKWLYHVWLYPGCCLKIYGSRLTSGLLWVLVSRCVSSHITVHTLPLNSQLLGYKKGGVASISGLWAPRKLAGFCWKQNTSLEGRCVWSLSSFMPGFAAESLPREDWEKGGPFFLVPNGKHFVGYYAC